MGSSADPLGANMTAEERDKEIAALIRTKIEQCQLVHAATEDRFDRALIVKFIEGLREALALVDPAPNN